MIFYSLTFALFFAVLVTLTHLVKDCKKPPFDPPLMAHFRKRLMPEILGEINQMISRAAKEQAESNE